MKRFGTMPRGTYKKKMLLLSALIVAWIGLSLLAVCLCVAPGAPTPAERPRAHPGGWRPRRSGCARNPHSGRPGRRAILSATSRRSGVFLCPAHSRTHDSRSTPSWPAETSGSLSPSPARSASAGTTRPRSPSATTRIASPCASTASGAGGIPGIARRARSARWPSDRQRAASAPRAQPEPRLRAGRSDGPRPRRRLDARLRRHRAAGPARAGRCPTSTEAHLAEPGAIDARERRARRRRAPTTARPRRRLRARATAAPARQARASASVRAARQRLPARFLGTSSTSCAASSGPTAVRSARAPRSTLGVRDRRRRLSRPARRDLEPARSRPSCKARQHVSLVRHQHLLRAREQGQAEPRAPCRPR